MSGAVMKSAAKYAGRIPEYIPSYLCSYWQFLHFSRNKKPFVLKNILNDFLLSGIICIRMNYKLRK